MTLIRKNLRASFHLYNNNNKYIIVIDWYRTDLSIDARVAGTKLDVYSDTR